MWSREIQFAECTIRSGGEGRPENVSADAGQSGAQRRCAIAGDVVRRGHDRGFTGAVQVEHVRTCVPQRGHQGVGKRLPTSAGADSPHRLWILMHDFRPQRRGGLHDGGTYSVQQRAGCVNVNREIGGCHVHRCPGEEGKQVFHNGDVKAECGGSQVGVIRRELEGVLHGSQHSIQAGTGNHNALRGACGPRGEYQVGGMRLRPVRCLGCIDRAGEGCGHVGIVNDQRGIGRVQDHAGTLRRVVRVNRHKRCSRPQRRKQGDRNTDSARQPQRHHITGACPLCGDVLSQGGRRRVELGVREGGGPILHGHGIRSGCRMRRHSTHHILRSGGYLRQV